MAGNWFVERMPEGEKRLVVHLEEGKEMKDWDTEKGRPLIELGVMWGALERDCETYQIWRRAVCVCEGSHSDWEVSGPEDDEDIEGPEGEDTGLLF